MLVVSANWGIGDGSIVASPGTAGVERFVADVREATVRAGWRDDGRYEPVRETCVVLAGDTCDWLLSREWLAGARPWDAGRAAGIVGRRVVASALRAARRSLLPLGGAVARGFTIPDADRRGRPCPTRTVHVRVSLAFLEGNLDVGLVRLAAGCPAPVAASALGDRWSGDGVAVLHGDRADPAWRSPDDDRAAGLGRLVPRTLGASLRVDLLSRFALAPEVAAAGVRGRDTVGRLAAVDPLDWHRFFGGPSEQAVATELAGAWRRAVTSWESAARRGGVRAETPFDAVEALAARFLGRIPAGPDEVALALRPAVAPSPGARPGTLVLAHPGREHSSDVSSRPRIVCLGGGEAEPPPDSAAGPAGVNQIVPSVGAATRWPLVALPGGAETGWPGTLLPVEPARGGRGERGGQAGGGFVEAA